MPKLVCRFFQLFLFSGESHLANFNFSKLFFQLNWKVKIKTHLNNIRIFQNLFFFFLEKDFLKNSFSGKKKNLQTSTGSDCLSNPNSID